MKSREVMNDCGFANQHMDAIKGILYDNAMHFISVKVAPDILDMKTATDLIIGIESGDVAVRIRRNNCRYRDLTIRAHRDSGVETEIDKIRNGFARWYLYGWSLNGRELEEWILVDLDVLRNAGLLENRSIIMNNDGTGFIAISQYELNLNNCIVAKSD